MTKLSVLIVCCMAGVSSFAHGASQWQVVWSDEFNDTGAPDAAKWGYEIGANIRNNEAQYYTNRSENVRVENGNLVIEARKESYQGASYTSASIQTLSTDRTKTLFSVTGGRLEIRAKVPPMSGCWPAFWTMGTNIWNVGWPKGGEIDVMEYVAHDPYIVYSNIHYLDAAGNAKTSVGSYDPRSANINAAPLADDFHTYRVDWYPDRFEWYFDGIKYAEAKIDPANTTGNPFNNPHYLILNLAVGGNWGSPIDPNLTSQQFLVDYVRVSQLVEVPEPSSLAWITAGACYLLAQKKKEDSPQVRQSAEK